MKNQPVVITLFSVFVFFLCLLFPLGIIFLEASWYVEEFNSLNVSSEQGMQVTNALFSYFFWNETRVDSLQDLTSQEKEHLHDVRALVRFAVFLIPILLIATIALSILYPRIVVRSLMYGSLATLIFLAILLFTPFESLFIGFHHLFFADGTWQFPETSILLHYYPDQFWFDIAKHWFVMSLGTALALLIGALLSRHILHKMKKL